MNKKEKCIATGLSIFLFLCAIINFAGRQIGAAICSLGSGVFFLGLSLAPYEEIKKGKENRQ